MIDFISLKVTPHPYSDAALDLICDALAPFGFDSFEIGDCYVVGYKPKTDDVSVADLDLPIAAALIDLPVPVEEYEREFGLVEGRDWNEEWEKNYFQPIAIGDREGHDGCCRCVIHSTFHKDYPAADLDVVIDPKMAFGTGHHSTTSLIVRRLLDMDLAGISVIDMGTGTGILSIVCAKLGASPVTGIEIDPGAWENAEENVSLNGVDARMVCGDALALEDVDYEADVFLANINRNIILADLEAYAAKTKSGGCIILSGFYTEDIPYIEATAADLGLNVVDVTEDSNWVSVKLKK